MNALLTPALAPLCWLTVTVGAYLVGVLIQRRLRGSPLANPVLIAIVLVGAVLALSHTPYANYFQGAQFIHFLLGPTTVALAIPLLRNLAHIRRSLWPIGAAIVAGSLVAGVSGLGLVWLLGGSRQVALSMAPKAATTPIAMAISTQIGGVAALSAVFAILGGIVAAVAGPSLLKLIGVTDWRVHGLAAGTAGSGIAAAQAASLNGTAAAFAALAIGLNGLISALLVPLIALLWPH
ncbi:MAG: LrgB family protein [Dyella sp.]